MPQNQEEKRVATAEEEMTTADIKSMEEGVARRRLKELMEETTFYYAGVLELMSVGALGEPAISFSSMLVRGIGYRASCTKWKKETAGKVEVPKFLQPKHTIFVHAPILVPWARETYQVMKENSEFSARGEMEVKKKKQKLTGFGGFIRQWFYPHLPEKVHLPLEWRALGREDNEGRGLPYNVSPKPIGNETALGAYRSAAIRVCDGEEVCTRPGVRNVGRKAKQAYLPPGYIGQKISSEELREAFPGLVYESDSGDDEV